MCKRSNAFSRPVLIIRGLDFENTTNRLWSFEGRARPRFDPDKFPVVIARGKHLFPFRTEKLSPSAPMVLGLRRPGRVGRRRDNYEKPSLRGGFSYFWRSPLSPSGDSAQYAATTSASLAPAGGRRRLSYAGSSSPSPSPRSSSKSPRGGQSSWASQRLVQCRLATFWSGTRMCPLSSTW